MKGERELEVLLSYLLNKQLKQTEVIVALGISRSAYNDQKTRGVLASPANLLAVARYFGLNPVSLLMQYGYVDLDDVRAVYANADGQGVTDPIELTKRGVLTTAANRHVGPGI